MAQSLRGHDRCLERRETGIFLFLEPEPSGTVPRGISSLRLRDSDQCTPNCKRASPAPSTGAVSNTAFAWDGARNGGVDAREERGEWEPGRAGLARIHRGHDSPCVTTIIHLELLFRRWLEAQGDLSTGFLHEGSNGKGNILLDDPKYRDRDFVLTRAAAGRDTREGIKLAGGSEEAEGSGRSAIRPRDLIPSELT